MSIKRICKVLYKSTTTLCETIVSLLSVLLFSKKRQSRVLRSSSLKVHNECVVLGTGPSLKEDMPSLIDKKVGNADFCAVNAFCLSDYFISIKPQLYVLIDNAWFVPTTERGRERSRRVLEKINEVTWPMIILIPWRFRGTQVDECIKNKNVKVTYFNDTPVSGWTWLRHTLYKRQLGMPSPENVLNAAISLSIYLGYETVYVFGADHSWPQNIYVDDNNVLVYLDKQVYKAEQPAVQINHSIAEELRGMYKCFISHMMIKQFSDYMGCRIKNCTHGSYIDAYERDYNWTGSK